MPNPHSLSPGTIRGESAEQNESASQAVYVQLELNTQLGRTKAGTNLGATSKALTVARRTNTNTKEVKGGNKITAGFDQQEPQG